MVRFLMNHTPVSLAMDSPDQTVLDYLREDCRKCGTKEGCASGDCGACTVVVASLGDNTVADNLVYQSVNACITFVGALHGKQLITVEDLAQDGQLHPVQQAMQELHGSQCGFCTPGFIMSMFALYKNISNGNQVVPVDGNWLPVIESALGGNLCRCTGYRPIVDACLQSIARVQEEHVVDYSETETRASLLALNDIREPEKENGDARFFLPQTLQVLDELLKRHPDARLLAGGTDLALETTQQLRPMKKLICLQQLDVLEEFKLSQTECVMGAGVSLSRCMQELGAVFPELSHLLHRFGSTQIRNQGTVGGNIANASPIGDLPPVFLALDATLQLRSAQGTRELPLVDFFTSYKVTALQPGEYIQSVKITNLDKFIGSSAQSVLKIYKISKRIDDDISAVCAAFNLTILNNRIESALVAFGGMAAVPKRAENLEALLLGRALSMDLVNEAKQALLVDYTPISDARASAAYRQRVAGNLIERLILELNSVTLTQVVDYV